MSGFRLPTKAERKAQRQRLRAGQKAQRQRMKAAQKAQLDRLKGTPLFIAAQKKRAQKRRRNLLIALLIALLLLLLSRCECDEAPEYGPPSNEPATVVYTPEPAAPPAFKPGRGRTKTKKRPKVEVTPPPPPPWLDQFRLQVAARAPRLATCLNGADRPGALKLSGLVHAKSGRVTAAKVEPAFRGSTLSQRQLDCLVQKLVEQPYNLKDDDPEAAARRVSLIFEF